MTEHWDHEESHSETVPPAYLPLEAALRERQDLAVCANALGLAILLYLFVRASLPIYLIRFFQLLMPELRYFNSHFMGPDWMVQLIDVLCFLISVVIPFGLYLLFIRMPRRVALPFRAPRISLLVPAVFVCLGASIMGSLFSSVIARFLRIFGLIPIVPVMSVPLTPDYLLSNLLQICILPALLEELVYRGAILQSLRRFGDGFAIVISAAVFSIMHLNLTQAPTAFIMGLVLGYFVVRTGSLWTVIIIHLVNNALALTQEMVTPFLSYRAAELLNFSVAIGCLMLGLAALILLARGTEGLFSLRTTPSAFTASRKAQIFAACPAIIIAVVLAISLSVRNIQLLR